MGLSWTSFFLEILNFLVLVWVLKRLFYAPVSKAIEARKQAIQKTMNDAHGLRREAETLRLTYEEKLKTWEKEREKMRTDLRQELDEERVHRLKALDVLMADEKARREAVGKVQAEAMVHHVELRALQSAGRFASHLLEGLAGPELEDRIISRFSAAPPSSRALPTLETENGEAMVRSAYPLSADQKVVIESTLSKIRSRPVTCRFEQSPELIAGLSVQMGSFELQANVRDELRYFSSVGAENA